jgi:hypothetical protein
MIIATTHKPIKSSTENEADRGGEHFTCQFNLVQYCPVLRQQIEFSCNQKRKQQKLYSERFFQEVWYENHFSMNWRGRRLLLDAQTEITE